MAGTNFPQIAIAGCGAVTAVGYGVYALRQALRGNLSGLRPSPRFENPRYQSCIVGAAIENGHAAGDNDDPAWHLAGEAIREAREGARAVLEPLRPERVGLVLATTKANIEAFERLSDGRPCSETARRHLRGDLLAADLAAAHEAGGVVQCVSVACASGLLALQQGARLIRRGAADAVIVVGVDHLSAFVMAGFSALKGLDPLGCRPFDRDRGGLSPGEAGAAIVLARAQSAPECAVTIQGWGSSNDANHMTGPSRDGAGLASAIRAALDSAGMAPDEINYVNAHGTGTSYNDAMESVALAKIFGEQCPPVSGSKGMLGHTLGAAGVVETIIAFLAMEESLLPGTPRLNAPADTAPSSLLRKPRHVPCVNSVLKVNTGFGGVNAALILETK